MTFCRDFARCIGLSDCGRGSPHVVDTARAKDFPLCIGRTSKGYRGSFSPADGDSPQGRSRQFQSLLHQEGFFDHSDQRLLVFIEFKDTLDYLVGILRNWGFRVGLIHGGMKPGSREEPNSRLYTEQQFKDGAIQVLVATEAAGEGINLQCCHILFNYDI
ncbi:MAG: helicase-related protein, partial [Candidatus Binatia bacterium]